MSLDDLLILMDREALTLRGEREASAVVMEQGAAHLRALAVRLERHGLSAEMTPVIPLHEPDPDGVAVGA